MLKSSKTPHEANDFAWRDHEALFCDKMARRKLGNVYGRDPRGLQCLGALSDTWVHVCATVLI